MARQLRPIVICVETGRAASGCLLDACVQVDDSTPLVYRAAGTRRSTKAVGALTGYTRDERHADHFMPTIRPPPPVDPRVVARMAPHWHEGVRQSRTRSDHVIGWRAADVRARAAATSVAALIGGRPRRGDLHLRGPPKPTISPCLAWPAGRPRTGAVSWSVPSSTSACWRQRGALAAQCRDHRPNRAGRPTRGLCNSMGSPSIAR